MSCASKEIRAVIIPCFKGMRRNNARNVAIMRSYLRIYVRTYLTSYTFVAISYIASTLMHIIMIDIIICMCNTYS